MKKSFYKGVFWTLSVLVVLAIIGAVIGTVAYKGYEEASIKASYGSGKSKTTIQIEKKGKNIKLEPTNLSEKIRLEFKESGPFYGIKKDGKMFQGIHIGPKNAQGHQSTWYGTFTEDEKYWKGYFLHTYADGQILYQYNEYAVDNNGKIIFEDEKYKIVESYLISKESFEKVKRFIHYDIDLPFTFYDFETPQTQIAKKEPTQTQQVGKKKIKLGLIFCTSDITKYQYSKYSDVYLIDFHGGCPPSKPIEISYKQFSELRSSYNNYKLCFIKNTEGMRVYYTPGLCDRSFMGGPKGVIIKNDGKQFYYMDIQDETQIVKKEPTQTQKITEGKTTLTKFTTDEKYYALIIGNNNYQYLEKLDAAENDAKVLADVLRNNYGFEVKLLLNADYDATVNSIHKISKRVKKDENLLIFYAGHGELDKKQNRGYWLPVDASYELRSKWISNAIVADELKATDAKHVLLIVDSCFSGSLMRSASKASSNQRLNEKYIKTLQKKKTRLVITSGGNEPVMDNDGGDHSLFAQKLIDTLKANKSVINTQALFENIRQYVVNNTEQTPEKAVIYKAGHDGGDFLFFAKN